MDRTILHIDMNNFYASVELLTKPELKDKPVVVGGDESRRHGIVLAKNEIAKKFGIKTAETLHAARQKCPQVIILPPQMDLYRDFSRRAKEIYLQYSEKVQSFGPDEAWIDISARKESGLELAKIIQNRILNELGLTVSVGVSWNKTFAKMGSDYKKPFAITAITRENYKQILYPLDVGEFQFVGKTTAEKLKAVGVKTIGDLAELDLEYAQIFLGKNGKSLVLNARGEDDSMVLTEDEQGPSKSIGSMQTTSHDLVDRKEIEELFMKLSEEVAQRMDAENMRAYTIRIYVRDLEFRTFSRQRSGEVAVQDKKDIYKIALALFDEHFSTIGAVRLLGVTADKLEDKNEISQMSFMDLLEQATIQAHGKGIRETSNKGKEEVSIQGKHSQESNNLIELLSNLRREFGKDMVFLASDLGELEDMDNDL